MAGKNGFTLIEILISMVIIGLLAGMAAYHFSPVMEQTKAQAAKNNLLAIAAAEQKFNEDYAANCTAQNISPCYCISTGTNPVSGAGLAKCGDTTADLNVYLRLGMSSNDPFTYNCTSTGESIPYNCTATDNTTTPVLGLTLDPNNLAPDVYKMM